MTDLLFKPADSSIYNGIYDIYVEMKCVCGHYMTFTEAGRKTCKCGKVYRLVWEIEIGTEIVGEEVDIKYLTNELKIAKAEIERLNRIIDL